MTNTLMRHLARATSARRTLAQRAHSRGLILPLVLLALAVAVILGSCFLGSASTATALAASADHRLRARNIAESGLAITLACLEGEVNWRSTRANGAWVTTQSLDGGTFAASVEDGDQFSAEGAVVGDSSLADDANDPVVVTCVGTYQGTRHLVRAVRYPPKAAGISVNERVEVRNTALLNSYNPDLGPYSAAAATNKALAKSNGVLREDYVKLLNTSRVNGNVYFGPGGSLTRSVQRDPGVIVTGAITSLPSMVAIPQVAEPAWPANPTGVARSHSADVHELTSDQWIDRLDLTGTATLRAVGDVKLYVSGPVTIAEDAKIDVGRPSAFGAAIRGSVSIDSNYPMDSYDSSVGPYGGTNVGSNVVIATNSTAVGAITVESPIKGDVYTGVGSLPATSVLVIPPGSISGATAALTTPMTLPPPPAYPTGMPPGVGDYQVKDVTSTLAADLQTNNFSIEGNALLRVSGHRKIRVNGNFLMAGNGVIDIPADSSLQIYVAGAITVNGNGFVANNSKSPPRLQLFAMGTQPILLSGNADIYAIIDAPNAPIRMEGNAVVYGAIMGASLELDGNAIIHNDRNPALVDTNPRLAAVYSAGSKLTLYANDRIVIRDRARINPGTLNPQICVIHHLGPRAMEVRGDASGYAEVTAPETKLDFAGAARWTGKLRARDLLAAGTAVLTADASGGTASPGILVNETIELRDSATVNGIGGMAALATNGAADYTIEVTDTAAYKGDGYITPGGNPNDEIRVVNTATFTGTKNALAAAVPLAALTAPPPVGLITDRTISGSSVATISGDVYHANFTVTDDAVLEVEGTTRLVVTGNLQICRNAQVVLRPDARLTVYCAGNIRFAGNVRVNHDGNPSALTFSFPAAPEVEVRGTCKVTATVLAPLAQMRLTDTAEFFGVFTGRRLKVDGAAQFYCAQNRAGPITWIEQQ